MKKVLGLIACVSAFVFSPPPVLASDAAPLYCHALTMHGTYAFGFAATDYGNPYSTSGMESYDGLGTLKYTQLWNEGGVTYTYNGTGTISITANCIATVIYDGDVAHPWTYFVAPDGSGYYWNHNGNTGAVAGGRVDQISKALLVK